MAEPAELTIMPRFIELANVGAIIATDNATTSKNPSWSFFKDVCASFLLIIPNSLSQMRIICQAVNPSLCSGFITPFTPDSADIIKSVRMNDKPI